LRQVRVAELEDRLAAGEVLEAVLAQRLDAGERRQVVATQIVHRFRQQRLAAVPRRQQPRDAIEGRAEVVAVALFDGPGVQRHPHAEPHRVGPALELERALRVEGRRQGVCRR
jgi:hypothetical protein